jgi:hypothetical protein
MALGGKMKPQTILFIFFALLLAACTAQPTPQVTVEATATPQPTATATLTPTASVTPTPAETKLTAESFADASRFFQNDDGTYSLIENGTPNPDFKFDRENEAVRFVVDGVELVQPLQAYEVKDGVKYVGIFRYESGVFVPERGYSAAEALAGVVPERAVWIDAGKEAQGVEAMFEARDWLMENTPGYTPADEFKGLAITLNFETFENFDPRPEKWSFVNASTIAAHDGKYRLLPKASDDAVKYSDGSISSVVYDSESSLDYAKPMQPALDVGWIPVNIIGADGAVQELSWQIPVVAMDTDGSIIVGSALVRNSDIPKMRKLLSRENRGKLTFNISTKAVKDPYAIDDQMLVSLASEINSGFCRTVGCPDKNELRYIYKLPDIFERLIITLTTKKENLSGS